MCPRMILPSYYEPHFRLADKSGIVRPMWGNISANDPDEKFRKQTVISEHWHQAAYCNRNLAFDITLCAFFQANTHPDDNHLLPDSARAAFRSPAGSTSALVVAL